MITLSDIHKKLADAINNSGMTRTEIGKRLGISQSAISHMVKGDIYPSLDTFANLCQLIGVDANDILCIREFSQKNK